MKKSKFTEAEIAFALAPWLALDALSADTRLNNVNEGTRQ